MLPPGDPNNEVKASVSFDGAPFAPHVANGNNTGFSKSIYPNSDTVITIQGTIGEYGTRANRTIEFKLVNISSIGTFLFPANSSSRQQVYCTYTIGQVFFSSVFELYFCEPGTLTIQVLTPTSIQGTFNSMYNRVVMNGTFKGNF